MQKWGFFDDSIRSHNPRARYIQLGIKHSMQKQQGARVSTCSLPFPLQLAPCMHVRLWWCEGTRVYINPHAQLLLETGVYTLHTVTHTRCSRSSLLGGDKMSELIN